MACPRDDEWTIPILAARSRRGRSLPPIGSRSVTIPHVSEQLEAFPMKKLINNPERLVDEALAGMALAHGDLIRIEEPNIIIRRDAPRQGKVGVISGGGSGHEPMHGGFVGLGMLDAACAGAVFTSPVPDQMLAATKAVNGGAGVLHIVKNYTGDIMHIVIARNLVGSYSTSLEMAGLSITLLKLDDELLRYWDAPVKTPGLRWGV